MAPLISAPTYSLLRLAFIILISLLIQYSQIIGSAFARPLHHHAITSPSFRLSLYSLDFMFPNETFLQGMKRGLHRSSLRLKHFQHVTSKSSVMAKDGISFETPVSTLPGGFLTSISIGTPPVSFTAIVDTGSDLVWRQCLPCLHCYEQDSGIIFNPSDSSTYQHAPCGDTLCSALPSSSCSSSDSSSWDTPSFCTYTYRYGDQSFTMGDLSYDTLTLLDLDGQPQSLSHFGFGCGHDNGYGNFSGAGGIIGFGQGPISLPSQLNMPKFSYCLQSISDAASLTSPLFIGSAAEIQSTSPSDSVLTTPIISNPSSPTFYYVNLKKISVGNKAVNIPPGTFDIGEDGSGGMIFDSGTTLTYLAADAYDAVVAAFKASIPHTTADGSEAESDLCYTRSSWSKLKKNAPSLTFHFEGADMQLPLSNYFVDVSKTLVCLALDRSGSNLSIYGNIQQQNFRILYDLEAHLLSFIPAACDTL